MDEIERQAFTLFAEGKSVNHVAVALFNNNWTRAKKLKAQFDAGIEEAAEPVAVDEEAAEIWDLTLKVPAAQTADIFATFSIQEQIDAIANVLQNRLNVALGVVD